MADKLEEKLRGMTPEEKDRALLTMAGGLHALVDLRKTITENNDPHRVKWEGVWYYGPPADAYLETIRAIADGAERVLAMAGSELSKPPEAADEITRLNAENEELKGAVADCREHEAMANAKAAEFLARAEKAEALVDEMREGLEPFAKAYDEIADGKAVWIERPINDDGSLMIQHFRQARALITKAQPPVSHDQ